MICLQVGKQAETHVWDATTMRTVSVLKGFHKRGVICVDFSGTNGLPCTCSHKTHTVGAHACFHNSGYK